jgi:hypothetical protein
MTDVNIRIIVGSRPPGRHAKPRFTPAPWHNAAAVTLFRPA